MRLLFVGDIFGRPGRRAVEECLPSVLEEHHVDFCIANGENAAAGKGLTADIANALFSMGVDVITGGNHIWHHKEIIPILETEDRILRPINFPAGVPGKGWGVYKSARSGDLVGVISAMGRIFLRELDNPFHTIEKVLPEIRKKTPIILVDFHAEATSEKIAMGWFLDGKVSACIGTHTHIPTADEKIMPQGTAYLTDSGMTGPYDSIIGVRKEIILEMFLTQMPVRHEVATDDVQFHSVLVEVDNKTGKATKIYRIRRDLKS